MNLTATNRMHNLNMVIGLKWVLCKSRARDDLPVDLHRQPLADQIKFFDELLRCGTIGKFVRFTVKCDIHIGLGGAVKEDSL